MVRSRRLDRPVEGADQLIDIMFLRRTVVSRQSTRGGPARRIGPSSRFERFVVMTRNVEQGGKFEVSDADTMLKQVA